MTLDPMIRTELTGPWAGFGFQKGHLWTPEGHSIEPEHMVWMSLTANIAREWRLMMAEARSKTPRTRPAGNVVYLRDVIRERREQQDRASSGPAALAVVDR